MKRQIIFLIIFLAAFSVKLSGQFGTPVVTGDFNVNAVLTAGYTGSPSAGDTIVYEWYYFPVRSLITTAATYTIPESDTTKMIYLKVIEKVKGAGTIIKKDSTSATTVNSFPRVKNVAVVGSPRSGMTVYGTYYYTDPDGNIEGTSAFRWYKGNDANGTGGAQIPGVNTNYYKIADDDTLKFIGFSVRPAATAGSTPSPATVSSKVWIGPVVNDRPVASSVSINAPAYINVNNVLTGLYDYTDTEGDAEGASVYEWWRSPDASFSHASKITVLASGVAYQAALLDTGKFIFFRIKPVAKTGRVNGSPVTSSPVGRLNTPPYASAVTITGDTTVGSTLTGNFVYHDRDGDDSSMAQIYKWYADNVLIPDETARTLTLSADQEGKRIRFEITPVADDGFPSIGKPVQSASTGVVYDNSPSVPVATNVCINGTRKEGGVLEGKYTYTFPPPNSKDEGNSVYKWYRNGVEISGETTRYYTLANSDLDDDIQFEVKPVSKGPNPKEGDPKMSASIARITMDKTYFLTTDKDTLLTAVPVGGYFLATEGVINGKFSARSVDFTHSPFEVTYHVNVAICTQDAVSKITVAPITSYFIGYQSFYCQNSPPRQIKVGGTPKNISKRYLYLLDYTAMVATQLGDTAGFINPGAIDPSSDIKLYFYAYDPVTYNWVEKIEPIVIEPILPVEISLADSSVFCSNGPKVELFVNQPKGVFTGPVRGNLLDPSLALGDTTVVYTYTSNRGCVSTDTVPIRINPAPAVAFVTADSCILNQNDITSFIDSTDTADPLVRWEWRFAEPQNPGDTVQNPKFLYTTGGAHVVTLTAYTVNGCSNTLTKTISLGLKPVADFTWLNECFHTGDSIRLFDATNNPLDIVSRTWTFDGSLIRTVANPVYAQKAPGYHKIEYIARTAFRNCHDTIVKNVYIRPTYPLAADSIYRQDFEKGNGGWVKDYEAVNKWSFGTPGRNVINSAASGDSAWYTAYDLTGQKEASYSVISPCFDFSIERPMIKMKLWKRFDRNRDGAALQYRVGDEPGWHHVGTLDDGIKWYNSTLIKGKPGGEQTGWTAGTNNQKDIGWSESSHKLDELVNEKDVKFRLVYGSDGTSQDNDGIAFDDIWIGSRTRGVLLEHFTNNSSTAASNATVMVSDLSNRDTLDVINIQYHTNFPGPDPYYNDNPGDASARTLFFGLTRAPYTFIDGGADKANYATLFDYDLADLDGNDVSRRSMISPVFSISLNASVAGGVISVDGQIKAINAVEASNLTLYLAVTQKKSIGAAGPLGETEYFNVFRKFIPDAGGISLQKTWAKDDIYTLSEKTWVISNIPNASDIEVIAFLQNNLTKEVYQAESVITEVIVGINDVMPGKGDGFSLYPNPTAGRLNVVFEKPLACDADIRIYDFSGSLVRSYTTGAGETEYHVDDLGLNPGLYLVRIISGSAGLGFKKLIVSND